MNKIDINILRQAYYDNEISHYYEISAIGALRFSDDAWRVCVYDETGRQHDFAVGDNE